MASTVRKIADEGGYTLLETVVSMAIFVGVLIPLIATLGNFMLDGTTSQSRSALHEAQTEMTQAINHRAFSDTTRTTENGLIVVRKAHRNLNLVELDITVSSLNNPEVTILKLHKSVLDYQ